MRTTTVIVGAGHAGLAMSRRLTEASVDHVVLDRGEVANSWRTERWPSLRLLTPNWQTTLPDLAYDGADPDGYMGVREVVDVIADYAKHVAAPVQTNTGVESVHASGDGYRVVTDQGLLTRAPSCWRPARAISPSCRRAPRLSPRPSQRSRRCSIGAPTTCPTAACSSSVDRRRESNWRTRSTNRGAPSRLSTGEMVRMPRTYRGRDIFWWMDKAGLLDERYDEVDDIVRARHVPSPQLIGSPERRSLDLNALRAIGVRIVGRIGSIVDGRAQFAGSLRNVCALADLKMNRLLNTIDETAGGEADGVRPERTIVDDDPLLELDLHSGEISTIVWATGYRPDYSWLEVPVVGRNGHIKHDGGVVVDSPGLFVLGLPFLRRRRSTFINGAAADTADITKALLQVLR